MSSECLGYKMSNCQFGALHILLLGSGVPMHQFCHHRHPHESRLIDWFDLVIYGCISHKVPISWGWVERNESKYLHALRDAMMTMRIIGWPVGSRLVLSCVCSNQYGKMWDYQLTFSYWLTGQSKTRLEFSTISTSSIGFWFIINFYWPMATQLSPTNPNKRTQEYAAAVRDVCTGYCLPVHESFDKMQAWESWLTLLAPARSWLGCQVKFDSLRRLSVSLSVRLTASRTRQVCCVIVCVY